MVLSPFAVLAAVLLTPVALVLLVVLPVLLVAAMIVLLWAAPSREPAGGHPHVTAPHEDAYSI